MSSTNAVWAFLGPGHVQHHISPRARLTACGRALAGVIVNHGDLEPGSNPCRSCWSRVVGTKPPQDRTAEERDMPAKTKSAPKPKKSAADAPPKADSPEQNADKLKKLRAQRRVVKKHEIECGRLKDEMKLAREELEASRAELYRLIDDSPQGELFVAHVDTQTGEIETDEDDGESDEG